MEKNTKKYIKLYKAASEESNEKWGYYYPPLDMDEFEAWNWKNYKKFFENRNDWKTEAIKTKCYASILADILDQFGFLIAFQNGSYEDLNNVLYQTSRRKLLDTAMTASGTDHAIAIRDALLSFACNDFEIIEHFFPKHLPLSKGTYYHGHMVNLLHLIYYREDSLRDAVLKKVEKFMSKKLTGWEKYYILYFMALLNRDAGQASLCLQELCTAYQKQEHSVSKLYNALGKCFAAEIHGIYRFARLIDEDFFKRIVRPKHDCFFEEFEIWQQENHYPKGKLFYTYPPEMDYVNKMFAAELPTVVLQEVKYPNKTEIYKDEEKFADTLTENIKKIL